MTQINQHSGNKERLNKHKIDNEDTRNENYKMFTGFSLRESDEHENM